MVSSTNNYPLSTIKPMPSLFKPSPSKLRRILAEQSGLGFTYPEVGATAQILPLHPGEGRGEGALVSTPPSTLHLPPSYAVDHTRVELGSGQAAFDQAMAALCRWQQFDLGWLEAFPTDTPIAVGETVLVLARAGGLWWANAARIVYVVDEEIDGVQRFGFAYGTLPGHVESGEERFLVEWTRATDRVYFDIVAFSRPRHLLVRLNRGRARAMQKRFAKEAVEAMRRGLSPFSAL
jgi:uncharacterized protein (UPF0548 family)